MCVRRNNTLAPCRDFLIVVGIRLHVLHHTSTCVLTEPHDFPTPDDLGPLGMRIAYVPIRIPVTLTERLCKLGPRVSSPTGLPRESDRSPTECSQSRPHSHNRRRPAQIRLDTPFFPAHHLTLKLYLHEGTTALQITLAEIRWVKREWAGVEFVSLPPEDKVKLQRLCREPGALAWGDAMPMTLAPGVYVEEVDPGVPVMPEVARVTSRKAIEQWCRQELRWLSFQENGPRTWGQVVQRPDHDDSRRSERRHVDVFGRTRSHEAC